MTRPIPTTPDYSDLEPFEVLFDKSEPDSALTSDVLRFAGNLGFPEPPAERPWVYSNFVQSLDGMVTFGGKRPEGRWIAQSRHDRWMMDLLRAHADAVIYGANSLVQETLYSGIPGGPVFRITCAELLNLRQQQLGKEKQRNIIVTGSGNLKLSDYRLFQSDEVETWIVTTPEGAKRLGDPGSTRVLVFGEGKSLNSNSLDALLKYLRQEHNVRYLLCEGGPTLYANMSRGGWMDEKFITVAPQEIGPEVAAVDLDPNSSEPPRSHRRHTVFEGPGFTVETARWYKWMSCRKSGEHEFNRYRFAKTGPA